MQIKTFVALVLFTAMTVPSSAAIRYSFQQRARSDVQEMPAVDLTGHAVIDGDQTRVDFNGKNVYGDQAYVVSSGAEKRMFIVDPLKKTITEVNLANVANALAAARIEINNLKSDLKKLPDQMQIAGFPTEHYRLETSYDMTIMFGSMPLTQNIRTVVEKWTTSAFGDVTDLLGANLYKTGNPQLDGLIESETVKMKGLPLRQIITVSTGPSARVTQARGKSTPTRKQTSELLVTEVKVVPSDASLFVLPAGYRRVSGTDAEGEALHDLTLSQ